MDGLDDGAVIEVGEGGLYINREDSSLRVAVQEGLGKLVKLLCAGGASDRILVWGDCGGDPRGDVLGNGCCYNPAEYCSTCDMADATIGLEKWDDSCRSQCVEGVRVNSGNG